MADPKRTPSASSFSKPENLEKNDLEILVHGDTKNIYTDDSVDPTYLAKANVLNEALSEIGMGKYQVDLPTTLRSLGAT